MYFDTAMKLMTMSITKLNITTNNLPLLFLIHHWCIESMFSMVNTNIVNWLINQIIKIELTSYQFTDSQKLWNNRDNKADVFYKCFVSCWQDSWIAANVFYFIIMVVNIIWYIKTSSLILLHLLDHLNSNIMKISSNWKI